MNLNMLKKAVEMLEARGGHDEQMQTDIANCWIELAEMEKVAPDSEYCEDVVVIPRTLMIDFGNMMWYDDFGRKARKIGYDNMIAGNFLNAVRHDAYCTEVSELIVEDVYYLLHDLWLENENEGSNNADGSFKQPKDLTDEEREIVRDLICNYRDDLAGSSDEHFDRMQAILEKFR